MMRANSDITSCAPAESQGIALVWESIARFEKRSWSWRIRTTSA
jgi:hypothetical protein